MTKSATINVRVNQEDKRNAEIILEKLGISMASAISMYLKQIQATNGIPFSLVVPDAPKDIMIDQMSDVQLQERIQRGLDDVKHNRLHDIAEYSNILYGSPERLESFAEHMKD